MREYRQDTLRKRTSRILGQPLHGVLTICLLLLMFATGDCRDLPAADHSTNDVPPEPPRLRGYNIVVNVQAYGATPNDATKDTKAIQTAIDAAPDGSTIYFPAGTYLVGHLRIRQRSALTFAGTGFRSLLRRVADYIATFDNPTDLVIRDLAFDANGMTSFGGVRFYNASNVRITGTHFFDGNKQPLGPTDRFAYVFGRSSSPHQDIWIVDNLIEDLQLEVDYARKVRVIGNTVFRPVRTAGIGTFSLKHQGIAEDFLIAGNTIIDPETSTGAITAGLDPPTTNHCTFQRIWMVNNTVIYTAAVTSPGRAIQIGTPDNSRPTTGNVFKDIAIEGNVVWAAPSLAALPQAILANSSETANVVFQRLIVRDNLVINNQRKRAIDLRRPLDAVVENNTVEQTTLGRTAAVRSPHSDRRDNSENLSTTATLTFGTPASVPGSLDGTMTVPHASLGDTVFVEAPVPTSTNYVLNAFVSAAHVVTIRWIQTTGVAAAPPGGTYRVTLRRSIRP